jgi:hypothetical protein
LDPIKDFVQVSEIWHITARQYGEVVLPDAASGNNPGTRRQASHITVPVQGGYGAVFAIQVQGLLGSGAVAVQRWLRAEILSGYCYFVNNHWRSVAVQRLIEARKLSRFTTISVGTSGAYPGTVNMHKGF